jgi:tRNA-uridine 2-sulfurtransferase
MTTDISQVFKGNPSDYKVLVSITDSVDSFVATYLLKKQGFQVMALAIINWHDDKVGIKGEVDGEKTFQPLKAPKCHVKDISVIENFCEKNNIPLFVTDTTEEFKDKILESALSSKICGKTYQTCFRCTRFKIQVLAEKRKLLKCDFMSTAHYAKVYKNHTSNEFFIYKANDALYDQSHKLASVPKELLSQLILPLADLKRSEVLKIAKKFNISVDREEDLDRKSLCFVYENNFIDYVQQEVPKKLHLVGPIVEVESQRSLGDHGGLHNFYEGQENYVLKDSFAKEKYNVVDISESGKKISLSVNNVFYNDFHLYACHFSAELSRAKPLDLFIKIGFKEEVYACRVTFKNNRNCIINLQEKYKFILGNSLCVLYSSNKGTSRVLGYGFIGYRGTIQPLDRVRDYRGETDEDIIPTIGF